LQEEDTPKVVATPTTLGQDPLKEIPCTVWRKLINNQTGLPNHIHTY